MGLISWIKEKLGFDEFDFDDIELELDGENTESLMEALSKSSKKRRNLNIHDDYERQQYIREVCEMMAATSKDVDKQKAEYQLVLSKLADLEEIESLPSSDRNKVLAKAKMIIKIEEEEDSYVRPQRKITETQYRKMEQLEDDMPTIIKKMKEDEAYQMAVRRDLNLLEGEKGALAYQRKEDRNKLKSCRMWAMISAFAAVLAFILLWVAKSTLRMRIDTGLMILAALLALALTGCFVSFTNAQNGIAKANRKINRAISLQNSVKIKYVNITNLLDYTYVKYGVLNSHELAYMWDKYLEEKEARLHTTELLERLEEARRELYMLLKHYRINEPTEIIYNPWVIFDKDELEDTRRELNILRARLRKGIDFEVYSMENSKQEIQDIISSYPQYAKEIIAIINEYE